VEAFHQENQWSLLEESSTQKKVIETFHMRKLQAVSGGYYKMLESGLRKRRIAVAI